MLYAIIDLGTNTFNLLIAEKSHEERYRVLYKEELPVKLGEGGITKKIIAPAPFARGIEAMKKHRDTIAKYGIHTVHAFATSAIRSTLNGLEFTKKVLEETGISINIIPGDEEATYIYKGVKLAGILDVEPSLIMDIGGGSTEFIIADNERILWKQSFDLGVSRLLQMFSPSDPVTNPEIAALEKYFEKQIQPLISEAGKIKCKKFIGCSGSFESFAEMTEKNFHSLINNGIYSELSLDDFNMLFGMLIKSDEEERKRIKGLAAMRTDTIVFAALFVRYIIRKFCFSNIIISQYALKEGVLADLLL